VARGHQAVPARGRRRLSRRVIPAAAVACASLAAAATAVAHRRPEAVTQPATSVSVSAATLNGLITPKGRTFYFFRFGTTTAYGSRTPVAVLDDDAHGRWEGHRRYGDRGRGDEAVAVAAAVTGLAPSTTYHAELVAVSHNGEVTGGDVAFTTGPAPLPTPPTLAPSASSQQQTGLVPVQNGAARPPVLGVSVLIALRSGVVFVRTPGASAPQALPTLASIPVGSLIDTRNGSVSLRTAVAGGRTQSGTFHGGMFQVRQSRRSKGMTELALRGALPRCGRAGARAAARVSNRRRPRRLWGNDRHGRFRTRGANSVATVRGTVWLTEDRCGGTLTRVRRGSVSVRDLRRHRTVIVRAGHSYLAHR
jgi:hypothetical protein